MGVLLLALLSGLAWALRIPVVEGAESAFANWNPDEYSHVSVVKYIAGQHRLPPYTHLYATSIHPPLYHLAGALLYALCQATLVVRLFSALLGVGTVYFVYRAAVVWTDRPTALLAAALVTLIPMRASLSGAVNNENLVTLAAAGFFAALAEQLASTTTRRHGLYIALWVALAIGSKTTGFGLVLALVYGVGTVRGVRPALAALALTIGLTVLSSGWWYAYNALHYGDPLRKLAADRLWDPLQPGYDGSGLTYFLRLGVLAFHSFWGVFHAMRDALPSGVYKAVLLVQLLSGIGWGLSWRHFAKPTRQWWIAAGLFALSVTAIFLLFNLRHYTPQGRYFYVLLAPWGAATALGWRRLFPERWRSLASLLLVVALGLLQLWSLYHYPSLA